MSDTINDADPTEAHFLAMNSTIKLDTIRSKLHHAWCNSPFALVTALSLLILSGCATAPQHTDHQGAVRATSIDKASTTDNSTPLSSDLIFNLLLGEIAAQRGEHTTAYLHYMKGAEQTHNASIAERTTQLALRTGQADTIRTASNLWLSTQPDHITPHKILALLDIQRKKPEDAQQHLGEILRITQSQGRDGYIQVANALEKANNPTLALQIIQQLTQSANDNPKALFAVALTANRAHRYDLANNSLYKALELKPGWPQALILLSGNAMAMDNPAEAKKILQQSIESSPNDAMLRSTYAQLLMETQQFNAAYEQFLILNEQKPNHSNIIFTLGALAEQLEKREDAKTYFLKLITLKQRANDGRYHLGQIEEIAGNNRAAIEWYSKVKGEQQAEAKIRVAVLYAREGEIAEARNTLDGLRQTEPRLAVRIYLVEGGLLMDAGDLTSSMLTFNQAITQFPDNTSLLYARSILYSTQGQIKQLEDDLTKIITIDSNHADALNALGYALTDQTSRHQEALGYIKRALDIKPEHPAILDSMGWVLFRLGKNKEALDYLHRAMALQPDPEIAAHLGEVLWATGDTIQARQVWDKALASDPDSAYLNRVLRRYP